MSSFSCYIERQCCNCKHGNCSRSRKISTHLERLSLEQNEAVHIFEVKNDCIHNSIKTCTYPYASETSGTDTVLLCHYNLFKASYWIWDLTMFSPNGNWNKLATPFSLHVMCLTHYQPLELKLVQRSLLIIHHLSSPVRPYSLHSIYRPTPASHTFWNSSHILLFFPQTKNSESLSIIVTRPRCYCSPSTNRTTLWRS